MQQDLQESWSQQVKQERKINMTEQEIQDSVKAFEHAVRTGRLEDLQYAVVTPSNKADWSTKSSFDFDCRIKFRIKPSPKYRPYKIEEVKVGTVIRNKMTKEEVLILSKNNYSISIINNIFYSLENLFSFFENLDGTPCGILE